MSDKPAVSKALKVPVYEEVMKKLGKVFTYISNNIEIFRNRLDTNQASLFTL